MSRPWSTTIAASTPIKPPESDPLVTVDYDALEAVTVHEAIKWAMEQPCPVTLYLYDEGGGFSDDEEHFHNMAVRFEADDDDEADDDEQTRLN